MGCSSSSPTLPTPFRCLPFLRKLRLSSTPASSLSPRSLATSPLRRPATHPNKAPGSRPLTRENIAIHELAHAHGERHRIRGRVASPPLPSNRRSRDKLTDADGVVAFSGGRDELAEPSSSSHGTHTVSFQPSTRRPQRSPSHRQQHHNQDSRIESDVLLTDFDDGAGFDYDLAAALDDAYTGIAGAGGESGNKWGGYDTVLSSPSNSLSNSPREGQGPTKYAASAAAAAAADMIVTDNDDDRTNDQRYCGSIATATSSRRSGRGAKRRERIAGSEAGRKKGCTYSCQWVDDDGSRCGASFESMKGTRRRRGRERRDRHRLTHTTYTHISYTLPLTHRHTHISYTRPFTHRFPEAQQGSRGPRKSYM